MYCILKYLYVTNNMTFHMTRETSQIDSKDDKG